MSFEDQERERKEFVRKTEAFALLKEQEMTKIEIKENGEELKDLRELESIKFSRPDGTYYVREEVWSKMKRIAEKVKKDGLGIMVFSAYRSIESQESLWQDALVETRRKNPDIKDEQEIIRITEKFVARPENSPHCTGGSIDVVFYDLITGESLDFGTNEQNKHTEVSYTDYPILSPEAKKNRSLLEQVFSDKGFTNYPLEWWHYSYGNHEWAAYSDRAVAKYGSVENIKAVSV